MIKTVSVETMRLSDAWTIEHMISSRDLMMRAGRGIFEAASWNGPGAVVCGKGNNAGDGFVVASLLADAGVSCDIILLADSFSEDGRYYYDICMDKSIRSIMFTEGMDLSAYSFIVDCIFGTGFSGEPRALYASAINAINTSGAYVVSADINSGLNGDTGLGTTYVVSDLTVSIGDYKPGHFTGLAYGAMKDRVNVDIGIQIQGEYIFLNEPDLVVLVDLETGAEEHFRDAESFAAMDEAFAGLDYFERTARYASEYVSADDREIFLAAMQLSSIKEQISRGEICSLTYHADLDGWRCEVTTRYIPYRAGLEGSHLAVKTVTRS